MEDKLEKIENLFKKIVDIYEEIPFGNSDYQIIHSVINKEKKFVHRAMRGVGLYLVSKLQNLYEFTISEKEIELKKKKLQNRIENEQDEIDRELFKLELKKLEFPEILNKKLLKDLLHEIQLLLPIVEKIGKIPREEFEKNEKEYFKEKFENNLNNIPDSLDSIIAEEQNIFEKIIKLENKLKLFELTDE